MADRVRERILGRALRVAIVRAGAPSGLRFTERQLYYEVCRALSPLPRGVRHPAFTLPAPVRYPDFQAALRRHGEVPGLLTPAPARPRTAGRHTPEPDLFDYGLPRLLVCESDAIAQMLRANGVPMESACPVLGASELPLDPRVADMMACVERASVYLLHDASPRGLAFPARLAELTDIPEGVRVVPLGLRPRQAGALHLTHRRGSPESALIPDGVRTVPLESRPHEMGANLAHRNGTANPELADIPKWGFDESLGSRLREVDPHSTHRDALESELTDTPGRSPEVPPPGLWPHEVGAHLTHRNDPTSAPESELTDITEPAQLESRRRAMDALPANQTLTLECAVDPWERAWLHRGRFVEVDAVRPASLLRTVHRLVREVRSPPSTLAQLRSARTAGFLTWPTV
ncbi:hypothetical protein [Nocardia sp. NPDC050710]|uniref:hypothetical protein n=1 Tax=Nocardia sp. NPDC050710 TaxID=3157220 RepID=UPI003400F875